MHQGKNEPCRRNQSFGPSFKLNPTTPIFFKCVFIQNMQVPFLQQMLALHLDFNVEFSLFKMICGRACLMPVPNPWLLSWTHGQNKWDFQCSMLQQNRYELRRLFALKPLDWKSSVIARQALGVESLVKSVERQISKKQRFWHCRYHRSA